MNKATKTKAMAGIHTFLERGGFEIVEVGWKSGKLHVDLIARDEDDLVFVDCMSCIVFSDTGTTPLTIASTGWVLTPPGGNGRLTTTTVVLATIRIK